MANDTTILTSCIIALLVFNTFITLYNEEPIETNVEGMNVTVSGLATELNESGITEESSGLRLVIGFGRFIVNLFQLVFWYYPTYPFAVNLIIKIITYIFAIPILLIGIKLIRGVGG